MPDSDTSPTKRVAGHCGLWCSMEVIGDRWSLLILRDAFDGKCHFEQFQGSLGIARNILAARLQRLVEHGVLSRTPHPDDKRRVVYQLTDKGKGVFPLLTAFRQWGERWEADGNHPLCQRLVDRRDHLPVRSVHVLADDGRELAPQDTIWIKIEAPSA